MVYVPMTHLMHRAEISPRAQELARRINEAITAYRESHPDLTGEELQQAMNRAATDLAPGASGSSSQQAIVLSVVIGLAIALGLGLFLLAGNRPDGEGASWPVLAVLVGVLALAAVFVAIRRSSR